MDAALERYIRTEVINYNPDITIRINKLNILGKPEDIKTQYYTIPLLELIGYTKDISRSNNFYYILKKVIKDHFIYCQKCKKHKSVHIHHLDNDTAIIMELGTLMTRLIFGR